MAFPVQHILVPTAVLGHARYAAFGKVQGSSRPSGKGLTGDDILLMWVLLDAARAAKDGSLSIKQARIKEATGREHLARVEASFERLRGTDLMLDNNVMPCIRSWSREGNTWNIVIDDRVLRVVRSSVADKKLGQIRPDHARPLSSRYSMALLGRWAAWEAADYPSQEIAINHKGGATPAYNLRVPLSKLPYVFGYYDVLRGSEIRRLLVTASPKCPIAREMYKAGYAIDIFVEKDSIDGKMRGLEIWMSRMSLEGDLRVLGARSRHLGIAADALRKQKERMLDKSEQSDP